VKFNIEVDLDWIEEGGIDDEIKSQMVNQIVRTLGDKYIRVITEDSQTRLQSSIDALMNETYAGFLDKGVNVTDKFGDVKQENVQVLTLIKDSFDKYLNEQVDKNGRACSYGAFGGRLAWMIDSRVRLEADKMMKDTMTRIDDKIKQHINASIKERLSASLLQKIDVDGIVESTIAGIAK